MTISEAISDVLPQLRRFARALTGSQQVGDEFVATALRAILTDPSLITREQDARLAAYRVLLMFWNAVEPSALIERRPKAPPGTLDRRIQAMSPLSRQAFLLTTVEEFSFDETAKLLFVDAATLSGLLTQASNEIAAQTKTSVLIVEDDPIIGMNISDIVTAMGHTVLGFARTHRDAVDAAKAMRPGLVLVDIQLADGSSGISAVNEILQSFAVPIVFITAHPIRLLTGEKPEPAYLVAKPFSAQLLKGVISQALFMHTAQAPA